jgi:hypothetical protein
MRGKGKIHKAITPRPIHFLIFSLSVLGVLGVLAVYLATKEAAMTLRVSRMTQAR